MITNWGAVEADWEAAFHRDLARDLFRRRKSWRWFETRVLRLIRSDTPTARLYEADHAHGAPGNAQPTLTPSQVGDWFASHVKR